MGVGPSSHVNRSRPLDAVAVGKAWRWDKPVCIADPATVGTGRVRMTFGKSYLDGLRSLGDREAAALEVLTLWQSSNASWEPALRSLRRARRRSMRRYIASHPERGAALRAACGWWLGTKKPIDPISTLCWLLKDRPGLPPANRRCDFHRAGGSPQAACPGASDTQDCTASTSGRKLCAPALRPLSAPEIVQLLEACEIERPVGDAAAKVNRRIEHARRRARQKECAQ